MKITLKTLVELETEINSGKTAHAAGLNHASAQVSLREPGRYFAHLDIHAGSDSYIWTEEDETHTLTEFIESIKWDATDAHDIEFKTYMSQQIWFVGDDVDPWDWESFVWPENHVESIDVIHASQAAAKA